MRAAPIVTNCNSSGAGSLADAVANAVANDTIAFAQDCTDAGAIMLTGTLTSAVIVTIDGTGRSVTISGGGTVQLFVVNSGVTLTLRGLTLANGKSTFGGAIFNSGGTLAVTNSTFSGNAAPFGGAIYNDSASTLIVTGNTFSGNAATTNVGGAINNTSTLTLTLSVVAGNTAGTQGLDLFGPVTVDGGGNVIGNTAGSTGLTNGTDKLNVPAPLGPLASNGGPTQTLALLPGSPAIDIAPCPAGLTTDGRGVSRPQPAGGNCDSGSFESQRFAAAANTGGGQAATVNTAFAAPVTLTLASTHTESVVGGQVTFTITTTGGAAATFPAAGSCILTSATIAVCPITGGGVATSPAFTANGSLGLLKITATASGSAATTYSETVTPGPATYFVVSGLPSPVTAGTAGGASVTAKDASGNTATGYSGTAHLTSSDP